MKNLPPMQFENIEAYWRRLDGSFRHGWYDRAYQRGIKAGCKWEPAINHNCGNYGLIAILKIKEVN